MQVCLTPGFRTKLYVSTVTGKNMHKVCVVYLRLLFAGYALHVRKDFEEWYEVNVPRNVVEYNVENLSCGASYQLYLAAYNSVGRGGPSNIISAKTVGVGKLMHTF